MIDPQQILYKAKGSKKVFKLKPYYELLDYDQLMFRKEKELYEGKWNLDQEYINSFIDDDFKTYSGQKYVYVATDIHTRKEYRSLSSAKLCEYIGIPLLDFLNASRTKSFIKTWICSREEIKK